MELIITRKEKITSCESLRLELRKQFDEEIANVRKMCSEEAGQFHCFNIPPNKLLSRILLM